MRRSRLAPAPASYEWLFDLLVGRTPAVSWAQAGELPAPFRVAEQFAMFPAAEGRSFLVSLATRPGTVSALTSYNALRSPRRRLARSVFALGIRAGLTRPLLSHRIDVGTAAGATPEDLDGALIGDYLQTLFGLDQVIMAIGGGSGPYRKPVLQVFAPDGTPLGYVKIGWNDWTRESVRREADALRACAARPMRLGVPKLLHHGQWRGLDLVVTAPMPVGVRRLSRSPQLPDVSLLREITQLWPGHGGPLASSPWWQGIRARIGALAADSGGRSWLADIAGRVELHHGSTPLAFGGWHGDLVPWNLARLGSRVYAWDWESSAGDAPVGFDALHFYFQVAFVERQSPLEQATALAARQARPALSGLDVAPQAQDLVAALHLIELAVRHEEAFASTGDTDGRFAPAITGVLGAAVQEFARQDSVSRAS